MPEESLSPIGVLVVDDHRMFAESLARLISDEADFEVVAVASNGVEALAAATRFQPSVALVDYNLPDRDGVQITMDLKQMMPSLMVVMLTGVSDDRVLLAAIEAGVSGFLTKDRAATEVTEALRAAAAGEALISPALLARLLPKLNRNYRPVGADLTERELQILAYLAKGSTNKIIAEQLHLSVNTIRNYVQAILTKLNAHSKLEAVSTAVREGIIDYRSAG